jgi:hypothetical protein
VPTAHIETRPNARAVPGASGLNESRRPASLAVPGRESWDPAQAAPLSRGSRRGGGLTEVVKVGGAVECMGINAPAGWSRDLDDLETCSPQLPVLLRDADVIQPTQELIAEDGRTSSPRPVARQASHPSSTDAPLLLAAAGSVRPSIRRGCDIASSLGDSRFVGPRVSAAHHHHAARRE